MTEIMILFSCRRLWNILVSNPDATIRKLMSHLNEDGILCISVPDIIYNNPKNVESYKEIPYFDDLSPKEVVRRTMINNFTHYHEYSYERRHLNSLMSAA